MPSASVGVTGSDADTISQFGTSAKIICLLFTSCIREWCNSYLERCKDSVSSLPTFVP